MDFYSREKNFTVYIFYASENGFSKSVADNFLIRIKKLSLYNVQIDCLNNFYKYSLKKGDLTFFLISTAGEGEIPSNGIDFYKLINNQKIENLEYSMLAFGNSNYKLFCNAGKILNTSLNKLGGINFNDITFFDDAIDDNDVIEYWISQNISYVLNYKNKLFQWFIKSMSSC